MKIYKGSSNKDINHIILLRYNNLVKFSFKMGSTATWPREHEIEYEMKISI